MSFAELAMAHFKKKVAEVNELGPYAKKKSRKNEDKDDDKPVVVVKPRKEIKPSSLVETTYLETQDDINGFMDALRRELEEAITKGERIQIR